MFNHKRRNRLSAKTHKLGVSQEKRQELVEQGLLATGGRVKIASLDSREPPRDRAAFVRALLGR